MHNIGAKLLIDAAQKSAEESGDGTTTCTVLATAMLQEGLKIPNKNIFIRKGMQSAVRQISANLAKQAITISSAEEVRNIALVSSNQDEHIANILTEIYTKVGLTGAISIQDGDGISVAPEAQFVEGVSFDSGFLSPYFADDRNIINYDHAYVALVDSEIQTEKELINLLEFCKMTRKPLIIVAQDFSSEALTSMVVNKLQLGLQLVAVKAPMFQGSELIQDLQYFTGAQVVGDIFSDYEDLASADPPYILGQIQSAKITAKESLFKGKPEQKSKIDERVTELENSMQDNMLMGEFEKENILERIGKLRGGLCIIKSGGLSEVEAKENRDRIEDALFAVKAALEDGYVVGGGFALV